MRRPGPNDARAHRSIANKSSVSFTTYRVRNLAELQSAFAKIDKKQIEALIVFNGFWPTSLPLFHGLAGAPVVVAAVSMNRSFVQ
jgi:hypothetical protein